MEKKILVIDDEENERKICKMILSKYNDIKVIEASGGHSRFELAKLEKPDLVILDNRMPIISGEQTAKLFRAEPSIRSIPYYNGNCNEIIKTRNCFYKIRS